MPIRRLRFRLISCFILCLLTAVLLRRAALAPAPILRYADLEEAPVCVDRLNSYDFLSVPTQITKIGDDYFIVDCYHDQILFSDSLSLPLTQWHVMTDEISRGHTVAGDGAVYLTDDTERNRVLVFEKRDGTFVHTQTISDVGARPHYIVYRQEDETFYTWSSTTGEMFLFRREPDTNRVYLSAVRQIDELNSYYVRSFTIMDDSVYFVSGNSAIIQADLDTLRIRNVYPVPDDIAGMIQLTWIDGYYYITVSTDKAGDQDAATLIRTKDLRRLADASYEDVYDVFIGGGTPYYISQFDGRYYLTEHRLPGHSIWSFRSENGTLTDVKTVYA